MYEPGWNERVGCNAPAHCGPGGRGRGEREQAQHGCACATRIIRWPRLDRRPGEGRKGRGEGATPTTRTSRLEPTAARELAEATATLLPPRSRAARRQCSDVTLCSVVQWEGTQRRAFSGLKFYKSSSYIVLLVTPTGIVLSSKIHVVRGQTRNEKIKKRNREKISKRVSTPRSRARPVTPRPPPAHPSVKCVVVAVPVVYVLCNGGVGEVFKLFNQWCVEMTSRWYDDVLRYSEQPVPAR